MIQALIEEIAVMKIKKITIIIRKTNESKIVIAVKSKFKFRSMTKIRFFESFKFETFTINFSSTSTISNFESIIKSDAAFIASSIFISTRKSSKSFIHFEELNAKKAVIEAKKAAAIVQKIKKHKISAVVVVAAAAIEETKSKIIVKNINFFDFTMQADF